MEDKAFMRPYSMFRPPFYHTGLPTCQALRQTICVEKHNALLSFPTMPVLYDVTSRFEKFPEQHPPG